jgi:hypothetical protein
MNGGQDDGFFRPGPLDAEPGFLYRRAMKTFIRILCLGLCLALASTTVWGKSEDHEKKQTKSKSESKAKSKHSSDSRKSKNTGKDKHKHKQKGKHTDKQDDTEAATTLKSDGKKNVQPKEGGEGFRDLAWGSPLSALKDPELREQSGSLKYYTVTGDNMLVLGVFMREIVYVFCQDKLAGVLTRYDGEVNQLVLLDKMKNDWGPPLESPPNAKGDRSWRFDSGETTVMMEYSEEAFTGALAWMAKDRLAACQQQPTE